jgi:hypothetical protein
LESNLTEAPADTMAGGSTGDNVNTTYKTKYWKYRFKYELLKKRKDIEAM